MNQEWKVACDAFLEAFASSNFFLRYQAIKQERSKNEAFLALLAQQKAAQKAMALAIQDSTYEEKKHAYQTIKGQVDKHPLQVNYVLYHEEIVAFLKQVEQAFR